jgi:PAS domain S-box-containing protein
MNLAKDIMTPKPALVQAEWKLAKVIELFNRMQIHCAPVIDSTGQIFGMMTDVGLVKASLRSYVDPGSYSNVYQNVDCLEKAEYVEDDDVVGSVGKALLKSPTNRLLVKRNGTLVGIISPMDLVRYVTGEQRKSGDLRQELEATKAQVDRLTVQLSSVDEMLSRYRKLFMDTPYLMHSVDAKGFIILANKKIHEVLGYGKNQMVGMHIDQLYPKSVHKSAHEGLKTIMREGFHQTTFTEMVRKNGERVGIDIASSALRDQKGGFIGTISISRVVDAALMMKSTKNALKRADL